MKINKSQIEEHVLVFQEYVYSSKNTGHPLYGRVRIWRSYHVYKKYG